MDELKERITEIRVDQKEVKAHLVDLLKQAAIHNHILAQHEQRSTQLEQLVSAYKHEQDSRLRPLEATYTFGHTLKVFLFGSSGLVATVGAILALFKHLK